MTYIANPTDPNTPLDSNLGATAAPELRALKLRVNELENALNNSIGTVSSELDSHINNLNNPHQTTKDQVGLGNVDDKASTDDAIGTGSPNLVVTQLATSNLNTALQNTVQGVSQELNVVKQDVATNASEIESLDTIQQQLVTAVDTNTQDIQGNTDSIALNAQAILDLDDRTDVLEQDVGNLSSSVTANTNNIADKLNKDTFDAKWKTDSQKNNNGLDFPTHYQYNFGGVHPNQNVQNRSRNYAGSEVLLDLYCVNALASGIRVGNRWHGQIRFEFSNDVLIGDTTNIKVGGRIRWDTDALSTGDWKVVDGDCDAMFLKAVNTTSAPQRPYVAGSFSRATSGTAGYSFSAVLQNSSTIFREYAADPKYFEFYTDMRTFFGLSLPSGGRNVCYVPVVLVLQQI